MAESAALGADSVLLTPAASPVPHFLRELSPPVEVSKSVWGLSKRSTHGFQKEGL